MASFRPNVVVSNSAPWEEDHWRQITVGSIEFEVPKPCARCQVPTVDPDTGTRRRGYEPIKTMKTYRSDADGEVYCGQNIVHLYNGRSLLTSRSYLPKSRNGGCPATFERA